MQNNLERNQKAGILVGGLYGLALLLLAGAWVAPGETRIEGIVKGRSVNIPEVLRGEPEYRAIEIKKIRSSMLWLKILLVMLAAGPAGLGWLLSCERYSELEAERQDYELALKKDKELKAAKAAGEVALEKKKIEMRAEAQLMVTEQALLDEVAAVFEANGWEIPEEEKPAIAPAPIPAPSKLGAIEPPAVKAEVEGAIEPEAVADRWEVYRQNALQIVESLVATDTSIYNSAPTRCGKTRTLYKWMEGVLSECPEAEIYIIGQKLEEYPGIPAENFCKFKPEAIAQSMRFLEVVYKELQERSGKPKKKSYNPVKLVLEDWFATYEILTLPENANLWRGYKAKLGYIVTVGGEYNVGYYINTQTFNIANSGVSDSNIRLNLCLVAQGLVHVEGKKEKGSYGQIELLINNSTIITNKSDRERLSEELKLLTPISMQEKTPVIISTIGIPKLGLMPKIELSNSAIEEPQIAAQFSEEDLNRLEYLKKTFSDEFDVSDTVSNSIPDHLPADFGEVINQSDESPEDTPSDKISSFEAIHQSDEVINQSDESEELEEWYKWLPDRDRVIVMLEETEYSFSNFVRSKLKKTDATYNKLAKRAIVKLLFKLDRADLIKKFGIKEGDYQ